MATITGKTDFARRVIALGLTLKELSEILPYSLEALKSVSAGRRALSPQLDWALKQIEKERLDKP